MVEISKVSVNVLQIREALRNSPEFFIHFFLGEQLTEEVPPFHIEVFYEMTHAEISRLAIAIPRGHAKTTLAKLACVWYLLFSEYRFILYVSGSHDLVVPYVNDIARFFKSDNFKSIFGAIEWHIDRDGTGEYKFRIHSLKKTCMLKGLGSGQRVRGINIDNERPQLAICDDLEDDEDVETDTMHKKMLRWFYGAFYKCLNPFNNKIIILGNLIGKQSVLYKVLQLATWRSFLYGALKADKAPLWPEMWSLKKLNADYQEYVEQGMAGKWFAEMMNQPTAEGGNIIDAAEIYYLPPRLPEEVAFGYITIDPAISKEKWADNAAVGAQGWVEEQGIWQVLQYEYGKGVNPTTLFWMAIKLAKHWGFRYIGVERAAMQEVLEHHFTHLLLLHNLQHLYEFVAVGTGNQRKAQRIISWSTGLKKSMKLIPTRALTYGDFVVTQQLLNYEPSKRENDDDVIDMLAQGEQMQRLHLAKIMQQTAAVPIGTVASINDIAQV